MSLRPLFTNIESIVGLLEQGTAVLTPNRRLSRAVREAEQQYRQDRGDQAWDSSTVMPLRQYWVECWQRAVTRGLLTPKTLLDASAQRLIWRRVIEADESVAFSLLSPSRAATLCQEASELLALWQVDLADANVRQAFSFDEDSRAFLRWEHRVKKVVQDMQALTPEQALNQLLGCPAALNQPVALLQGDDLPPLHTVLCEQSRGWQHVTTGRSAGLVGDTRIFADTGAELQAAARWCKAQYDGDPHGRYAVVLSDMHVERDRLEFYLRGEFDCLTQNYASLPVNFSTGFSLDRVPLVRDALRILELANDDVDVEAAIAILQSRFIAPLPLRREQREDSIRRLRELAQERIPQRVMRAMFEPLSDRERGTPPWETVLRLEANGRLHRRESLPSEWVSPFREILAAWGWCRGGALDSLEYQQSVQWQEALEHFATLDALVGRLGFSAAIQSLREVIAEQQFQPRTDDQAIQVLGPLETTGLSFDAIWITGMTAMRWPASAKPNPYLPLSLQRSLAMPHADANWEWRWANARWQQWCSAAARIQTSYVSQLDGAEVLPSPLLSELPDTSVEEEWAHNPRWLEQSAGAVFEPVALDPIALHRDERAAQGVGASVLEQQSLCPFQAFSAARLLTTPPPARASGLLASERGSLLHRALFDLWGHIGDSAGLQQRTTEELEPLIKGAWAYAERGLSKERLDVLGSDVLELEGQRLEAVLGNWLSLEREREEAFVVAGREEPREYQLAGLNLRLRLDRVDRIAGLAGDAGDLIIDYKSGATGSLNQWFQERPTRPQLPLYALLDPVPAGIAYASLKPGAQGFRGVGRGTSLAGIDAPQKWLDESDEGDEDGMETLRRRWKVELTALAEEFVSGVSTVDPTIEACRYCQRFALCRLGDDSA